MEDSRGVRRGRCSLCSCEGFKYSSEKRNVKCVECNHFPAKHKNLDKQVQTDGTGAASSSAVHRTHTDYSPQRDGDGDDAYSQVVSVCSYQGCECPSYFDLNTGDCSAYCERHMSLPVSLAGVSDTAPQQECKLPGCSRTAYVDPCTNEAYECCCKSHGKELQELEQRRMFDSGQTPKTNISLDLKCKNPWCNRKRWQEANGRVHDFCGITCRNNYRELQKAGTVAMPQSSKLCCLPGCKLPRHLDPSGNNLKFCGNTHKLVAQRQVLLELTSDAKHYQKTLAYFIAQWDRHKSAPPSPHDIITVFKIFNPRQKKIFCQYTKSLSCARTEKYFHGTSIRCDVRKSKAACADQKCGMCGISSRGFDADLIGSNIPRFMRFGKGFYLAPNSSKCHDYTQGIVDYRVMLLCEVAPGNKYKVTNDQTQLEGPPQGYDSVYGAKGSALNYDEIVLYCSESILPKYVIVYKRGGTGKIAN